MMSLNTDKTTSEHDRLLRENARLRGDLLTIASRISHDLRTPLGSILNSGELLREVLHEKEPSSVALTDPLFNSVEELQRLIKNISFVAKASVRPPSKNQFNMGEIVDEVRQELEARILKKQACVKSPQTWPQVEGVPGWIAYTWWNFIVNALQHGGPQIHLGWLAEKNGHRFWINDNGPGVPVQWRAKLFQPFDSLSQADSTRGLGLSVVQRLVELQDGQCGYELNLSGPRFFFTLPAK
ncbi:MAG TPA: HAMP domain-containing sensor histidine kinase [Candidatus Sulfotelmatobacter sp.]|jgi:signal transduction histidine kinase|nr:HAMP domain-containing sensor histidine kinase [Candidatus Sulfotelmatobacter sp.]